MKDALLLSNTACLHKRVENELIKMNLRVAETQRNSSHGGSNGNDKENSKRGTPAYFGCSLEHQLELVQTAIKSDASEDVMHARHIDVSGAMFKLCEYLKQADRLDTVGLFRIPGSQTRMKLLRADLEDGKTIEENYAHAHDIADLLKMFIRKLPEPLLPGWSHEPFVKSMKLSEEEKLKAVLLLCCFLPLSHLQSLIYLMNFLNEVINHSDSNKMSISNVCAMMTPNIMHTGLMSACLADRLSDVGNQLSEFYPVVEYLIQIHACIGYLPDEVYGRVCEEVPCLHSGDDSSLQCDNTGFISIDEGDKSHQKKRGLSERVATNLGKLMPKTRQKTPCKKETLERSLHNVKICRKRLSDAHDSNTQTAKRRSLQSPLAAKHLVPGTRVGPLIIVTSQEQDIPRFDMSPTPNCKFTAEDDVSGKRFGMDGHQLSCGQDHDRPRSARKLLNKFIRIRRRESGNTSCFCVQQANANTTQNEKHHGRFRRSFQRGHRRKSVDNIISVPVGPDAAEVVVNPDSLEVHSQNCGDTKGEKGSFFRRLGSPQPPRSNQRRSPRKLSVVSRIASSISHSRRKSRKSDDNSLASSSSTPCVPPVRKALSDNGSARTVSTDTLNSLSSDNTAETLDALDAEIENEPQQGVVSDVSAQDPELSAAYGSRAERRSASKHALSNYKNLAYESANGQASKELDDSISEHPESALDLSIETLIKLNDPSFKHESRLRVTLDIEERSHLSPAKAAADNLAEGSKEVTGSEKLMNYISPISHPALGQNYFPSPIQSLAPSPIMPIPCTPSLIGDDSKLGASPALCDVSMRKAVDSSSPPAADSSPLSRSPAASSSSSEEEIFDDSLGDVYIKFQEVDLSFQDLGITVPSSKVISKLSPELKQSRNLNGTVSNAKSPAASVVKTFRVARLRTSTRAAVPHSSPAKAPRINSNIKKTQSCHGRTALRRNVRTSRSMKAEANTPKSGQKCDNETLDVGSNGNSGILRHQTSTAELVAQAGQACINKRKTMNAREEQHGGDNVVGQTCRNTQLPHTTPTTVGHAVLRRSCRTPASLKNKGTPYSGITRSRVISRRSGGQLPRVRDIRRTAYSPKMKVSKPAMSPVRSGSKTRVFSKASPRNTNKGSQFGIQLRSGSIVSKKFDRMPLLSPHSAKAVCHGENKFSTHVKKSISMKPVTKSFVVPASSSAGDAATHSTVQSDIGTEFPKVSLERMEDRPTPIIQLSTLSRSQSMLQKCGPLKKEVSSTIRQEDQQKEKTENSRDEIRTKKHRKSLSAPGGKWSSDSSLYLQSNHQLLEPANHITNAGMGKPSRVSEFVHRFNELAQHNSQFRTSLNQGKSSSFVNRTNSFACNINGRRTRNNPLTACGKSQTGDDSPTGQETLQKEETRRLAPTSVPTPAATTEEATRQNKDTAGQAPLATSHRTGGTCSHTPKIKQPLLALPKKKDTKLEKNSEKSLHTSYDMLSDCSIIEGEESCRHEENEKGVIPTTPVIKDPKVKKKTKWNRIPTPNKLPKPLEGAQMSSIGSVARRGPLIIRNLNTQQDFLEMSPVKRATPKGPRSRAPIIPTMTDTALPPEELSGVQSAAVPGSQNHDPKLSRQLLLADKGIKSLTNSKRGPGTKKLCKSMEALDNPKSLVGKKSKYYHSVSSKDLNTTICNPMTVIDSRSVKHTAL